MQYTENLNLNKPGPSDQYNIQHFNDNFDTLDSHIHNLEEASTSVELEITEKVEEAKQFPNMNGVCPINKGGTGANNARTALNNLHSGIEVVSDIPANGEVTFINRTPADVEPGTPETFDVKGITLDKLAAKVYELIRADTGLFTQAKNGLVPKTGAGQGVRFLSSEGVWRTPDGASTVYEATASSSWAVNGDTILRIKGDCTSVVGNATVFGTRLTVVNETANYQSVSMMKQGGHEVVPFAPGGSANYVWTGYWNAGVGVAPAVATPDPRPVSSEAVASAIAISQGTFYTTGTIQLNTTIQLDLNEIERFSWVYITVNNGQSSSGGTLGGSFKNFDSNSVILPVSNFLTYVKNYPPFEFHTSDGANVMFWIESNGLLHNSRYYIQTFFFGLKQ